MTCDVCKEKQAVYDGKTTMGPWAYMCEDCFKEVGIGLGLGRGQRLTSVEAPCSCEEFSEPIVGLEAVVVCTKCRRLHSKEVKS